MTWSCMNDQTVVNLFFLVPLKSSETLLLFQIEKKNWNRRKVAVSMSNWLQCYMDLLAGENARKIRFKTTNKEIFIENINAKGLLSMSSKSQKILLSHCFGVVFAWNHCHTTLYHLDWQTLPFCHDLWYQMYVLWRTIICCVIIIL